MSITFDKLTGDIYATSSNGTTVIAYGVVLLTSEQAAEASKHGWQLVKTPYNERNMGLVRCRRAVGSMQHARTTPHVVIDGTELTDAQATLLRAVVQNYISLINGMNTRLESTTLNTLETINLLLSGG